MSLGAASAAAAPIKWIGLDICSPEAGLRISQFSSADYRVIPLDNPPHEDIDKSLTQPFGFDASELELTDNEDIVRWRGYEFRNCSSPS